ncbi:MAG: hypothetical protein KA354_19355 [Phycisphaerae bacterium]|nr:hypothetical protein [Phycisphaerae bacterium]
MELAETNISWQTVEKLREYLADVPFCSLDEGAPESDVAETGADWIGRLRIGDNSELLLIETKPSGQPRLAREAVNQLLRYHGRFPKACLVFAAPYISAAAGKIATDEGIGYLDLAGNCRLCFDHVYIRRTDWPNPAVERRGLRSLYSPKAERVLRALLAEPRRTWKIEPLAAAAQVSLGMASKVKRLLDDREWLIREAGGFRLNQPAALLNEWNRNYKYDRNTVHDFYSFDSIPQIEAKLAQACESMTSRYALTGFSAGARLAPMVRYQRVTAYVTGRLEEVAQHMGLKRVTSGANVSLIEPYDEGVLFGARDVDGRWIVSPLQAYLDLLNFRGRGEEAAEAILDQVVKPTW